MKELEGLIFRLIELEIGDAKAAFHPTGVFFDDLRAFDDLTESETACFARVENLRPNFGEVRLRVTRGGAVVEGASSVERKTNVHGHHV